MPIARSLMYRNDAIIPAPPPATPNYYSTATSGQWSTLPNSQLSAASDFNTLDYSTIVAWSGAIINTVGVYYGATFISGTFLITWGGGHTDTGQNTVYAYGPFESDSAQWRRLRAGTSPQPQSVNEDGSGNPTARHTYNSIAYDPVNNQMLAIGGIARYSDAGAVSLLHKFNFNQVSPESNSPWGTLSITSWGGAASTVAYDPALVRVWYHSDGANQVGYYDVAGNSHSSALFKSPGWTQLTGRTSALDTNRGLWAGIADVLNFYRTNNGTANDYYAPSTTGSAPTGNPSITYDPTADCFVCWNNGGKTLFFLTPPGSSPYQGGNAWTWSSTTPGAGSTPTAEAGSGSTNGEGSTLTGTYGRFACVISGGIRMYVLMNRAADSIYFYKP